MSMTDENDYQLVETYYKTIISSEVSVKSLILCSVLPSIAVIGNDLIINDKYVNESNVRPILEYVIRLCALSVELDINLIKDKQIETFLNSLSSDIRNEKFLGIDDLESDLSLLFPNLLLRKSVCDYISPCLDCISRELSPLKTKCQELVLIKKVVERPALFWPTIGQFSEILIKCFCHPIVAEIAYNFRIAVESNVIKSQTIFDFYPNCVHKSLILFRLFERIDDSIDKGFKAQKFSIVTQICVKSKQIPDSYVRLLLLIYPSIAKYIYEHKSCISEENYFPHN